MPTRLPTIGVAVADTGRTLRRFPLVLLSAVAAAVAAILAAEDLGPEGLQVRLLATATLGLPLFTALTVAAERRASHVARWVFGGAGVVVLATFYFGWAWWSEPVSVARYFQLSAAFHLMVAFLPFARRGESHAFWHFNRVLIERIIVSAAFSAILFVSLALALLAMDKLFGVDVPGDAYPRMWFLVAFVFNTWFFLNGVPADLGVLESRRDYSRGDRVLAQYVLVPIASAYLVILTAYLAKVVVAWDWPSGWIGWLVSSVAVTGILALLLVHPVAEDGGEAWVTAFARGFWLALLPAIVMLWLAIWQRVQQYGVTEPRYFLLVLSVWLAAAAVFYSVTRSRDMRLIPLSLGVVAVATFGGPWGAYQVSEASQARRLAGLLARNQLLVDGRARPTVGTVTAEDRREIAAALRYLALTHGFARIAPWFGDSLAPAWRWGSPSVEVADLRARSVARRLGIGYVGPQEVRATQTATYTLARKPAIPLNGFDYLVRVSAEGVESDSGYHARFQGSKRAVEVWRGSELMVTVGLDSAAARIRAYAQGRPAQERMGPVRPVWTVPAELMRAEAAGPLAAAVVLLARLEVRDSAGAIVPVSATGDVLLRIRR